MTKSSMSLVAAFDGAVNLVVKGNPTLLVGHLEADDIGDAGLFFGPALIGGQLPAGAVVSIVSLGRFGRFPFSLQLFLGAEALVCVAGGQQGFRSRLVFSGMFRLEIRTFIPGDAKPGEAVDDAFDGFPGGAFGIGVLYAQDQLAVVFFGKKPVVDGGAGPADMQITGGARWKADAYFSHDCMCLLWSCLSCLTLLKSLNYPFDFSFCH